MNLRPSGKKDISKTCTHCLEAQTSAMCVAAESLCGLVVRQTQVFPLRWSVFYSVIITKSQAAGNVILGNKGIILHMYIYSICVKVNTYECLWDTAWPAGSSFSVGKFPITKKQTQRVGCCRTLTVTSWIKLNDIYLWRAPRLWDKRGQE